MRTRYRRTDGLKLGKNKQTNKQKKPTICPPCLFNLYAEHILENAGLEERQAEIKRKIEISVTSDMHMTPPIWHKAKSN